MLAYSRLKKGMHMFQVFSAIKQYSFISWIVRLFFDLQIEVQIQLRIRALLEFQQFHIL